MTAMLVKGIDAQRGDKERRRRGAGSAVGERRGQAVVRLRFTIQGVDGGNGQDREDQQHRHG